MRRSGTEAAFEDGDAAVVDGDALVTGGDDLGGLLAQGGEVLDEGRVDGLAFAGEAAEFTAALFVEGGFDGFAKTDFISDQQSAMLVT